MRQSRRPHHRRRRTLERQTPPTRPSRRRRRSADARLVEAADRERRRIASDLHDGLQAKLVLLAMCADRVGSSRAPAAADVAELQIGLQEAIVELRGLVYGLMPAGLCERGLYRAVVDLADRVPIPIELQLDGSDTCLPKAVQSTGYFVVSEAVTNALKHACASQLCVRLTVAGGRLRIDVRDDGAGGAVVEIGGSLGRLGDRIRALGGRLNVHSLDGGGTRVVAEVPCES